MLTCPVCECRYVKSYISFRGYHYVKCRKCSLVFLDSDNNVAGKEKALYDLDYIKRRGYDSSSSYVAKAKEASAKFYLSLLERYVSKGRLLEIGCSTGIVLRVAADRGWEVFGEEINEEAVSIAEESFNINAIKVGPLNRGMFPNSFFSLVLMLDVLEHFSNPLELIEILREKLKQGGSLFLITPNINSISAKVLKGKWLHLFLEHLCLYSPQSITFLLERFKFKTLKLGWALKFVNIDMLKYHLECHPDILFARPIISLLNKLTFLGKLHFPFNVGEMYVLAQKQ
jgi:2-polyprenyl-3-methyl-5-hydroxy-6-metoxy-1,4-benzoquinol methylase